MAATVPTSLTLISSGLADSKQHPPKGNPDGRQFLKVVQKTTRWAAQWNRIVMKIVVAILSAADSKAMKSFCTRKWVTC